MHKVEKAEANRSSFLYTFDKYMVSVYQVLGTKSWVMAVYETDSHMSDKHSSKMSHVKTGKLYGKLTSSKFDCSLPVGTERSEAFDKHHANLCAQSYGVLFGLFPSLLTDGTLHFDDGEVELHGENFNHDSVQFYSEPPSDWAKVFRGRRNVICLEHLSGDANLKSWFDSRTFSDIAHFTNLGYSIA